jgi:hypothetical protein
MDVKRELLVYPAHEASVHEEVSIQHVPVRLRQTTINLSGTMLRYE